MVDRSRVAHCPIEHDRYVLSGRRSIERFIHGSRRHCIAPLSTPPPPTTSSYRSCCSAFRCACASAGSRRARRSSRPCLTSAAPPMRLRSAPQLTRSTPFSTARPTVRSAEPPRRGFSSRSDRWASHRGHATRPTSCAATLDWAGRWRDTSTRMTERIPPPLPFLTG